MRGGSQLDQKCLGAGSSGLNTAYTQADSSDYQLFIG